MATANTPSTERQRHSFWWFARLAVMVGYVYVLAVATVLIAAFVLYLFGVDASSGVVEWIYRSANDAMSPFRNIFTDTQYALTGNSEPVDSVLETSLLFALVSYGILALMAHDLIDWLSEADQRYRAGD